MQLGPDELDSRLRGTSSGRNTSHAAPLPPDGLALARLSGRGVLVFQRHRVGSRELATSPMRRASGGGSMLSSQAEARSAMPCCSCTHTAPRLPMTHTHSARSQSSPPPSCPRRSVISKPPRRAAPSSRRRAPHGHAPRSTGSLQAWDGPVAYPVAVGVTAAGHGIALEPALSAYLHAVTANLISAGVRLIPLGQTDGQRLLAALEPTVASTAARALTTPLDQLGGAAFRADIASMRHETQYTRLFRS